MELYVGIDDHANTCSIAVEDEQSRTVLETVVPTTMEDLRGVLGLLRGRRCVAVENGTRAEWLYHGLQGFCEDILVAKLSGLKKYLQDKNDRLDARQLAHLRHLGELRPIYQHRDEQVRTLKQAAYSYERLTQDQVRCKNRIKSLFGSEGIVCAGREVYRAGQRERWLKRLQAPGHRLRAELLMEQFTLQEGLRKTAERRLKALARQRKKEWGVLNSLPGIGPLFTARLLGLIGTVGRIRHKRALWKLSGLAVVSHSSSDYQVDPVSGEIRGQRRVKTYGLNRDCCRPLKALFKSAAKTAIATSEVFREQYQRRIEQGMRPEMARLTIARKLSAVLLACWKKGEKFDPERFRASSR